MRAWVGTSGFSYSNWVGEFYPKDLSKRRFLEFYAERFSTVEINSSFYHLPAETTVQGWAERVPEGFLFAMKAWRVITHRKRLKDVSEELDVMADRFGLLGSKLGPVLFQLPPNFKKDMERLDSLVSWLDKGPHWKGRRKDRARWKAVLEFRHESWFDPEVFDRLEGAGLALCLFHSPTIISPRQVTAPFLYLRFHGTEAWFRGSYQEQIQDWASFVRSTGVAQAYCYFNNDADGSGFRDAALLAREFGLSA